MNVWHDEGDDGVTGWQPIGEPLIRTTKKMIDADTRGREWAIIETDGGDITAERI